MKPEKIRTPRMRAEFRSPNRWFKLKAFLGCCECGVVHRFEWKLVRGQLYLRGELDEALTREGRASRDDWPCRPV